MKDFTEYDTLEETLPPLVRKQRRLEAQIVLLVPLAEEEKALRKEIDGLLVAAGIDKGDGVQCLGYDVCHVERVGTSRLNQDALIAELVTNGGLRREWVDAMILRITEVGDPSSWATVKPSKGSKVRANVATGKR